jgi:hypothetical protein
MKHTVEEVRLKNGARGLLIDVPGATVMSFQIQFRAGNRYVKSKHIYETAHIMEHMAFGANDRFRSEHEFESEFTKNGAYHKCSIHKRLTDVRELLTLRIAQKYVVHTRSLGIKRVQDVLVTDLHSHHYGKVGV